MISDKKHVAQLAAILLAKGIEDVVISPGSRNGPLIHTFAGSGKFNCRSIVDERSAAYFALGLAQRLNKPVAIACSSGTATLNYAPAITEAYYLNVPLVVLTADRPPHWIDQGENQTIRQNRIYNDFVKAEITLPLNESENELWHAGRMINEILNATLQDNPGPVHINIPMEEPLHNLIDEVLPRPKVIESISTISLLPEEELAPVLNIYNNSGKVLILAGQMNPNPGLNQLLVKLAQKTGAVVLKEQLSNSGSSLFCGSIDLLITSLLHEVVDLYKPDLLITFGGTFVSKPLKQFLRQNKTLHHWHINPAGQHHDTYHSLTRVIKTNAETFLGQLYLQSAPKKNEYHTRWKEKEKQVNLMRSEFIDKSSFSDLTVFDQILKATPEHSVLHLGNSSPVRYAMIFDQNENIRYMGNRGTSGIDGSLSTAVGFASASEEINTVILGDLSFFYDSNALWNKYIGKNLRIIVVHNGGGNIFSMIKGPGETPSFQEFFFTENKTSAEGIARTFGFEYLKAENEKELEKGLSELYAEGRNKAAVLEIFTDASLNSSTFRGLFKYIKKI